MNAGTLGLMALTVAAVTMPVSRAADRSGDTPMPRHRPDGAFQVVIVGDSTVAEGLRGLLAEPFTDVIVGPMETKRG